MSELNSILLVGGSGFLGLHIIEQFYKQFEDLNIHVFDIRSLPDNLSSYFTFKKSKINFFQGDICSENDIENAIEKSKCDIVIHCASPVHGLLKDIYEKVNITGTELLIKVSKKFNVKGIVYTSSASVIFNGQDLRGVNELYPYPDVHMDYYNKTKAIAEKMVIDSNVMDKFHTVSLRPSGIFGPGDSQLVSGVRKTIKYNQHRYQIGDNKNLVDWTFAGNVADAHVLAAIKLMNKQNSKQICGQCFFITNDSPVYFWAIIHEICKADGVIVNKYIKLNRSVALLLSYIFCFFSFFQKKENNISPSKVRLTCANRYFSIKKAKKLLDYEPKIDIPTGIQYTINWMKEN